MPSSASPRLSAPVWPGSWPGGGWSCRAARHARATDAEITDRYARAVGDLGHADISVRLGALYALERLARNSTVDTATIYEVLCAWTRVHSIGSTDPGFIDTADPIVYAPRQVPALRVDGQAVD